MHLYANLCYRDRDAIRRLIATTGVTPARFFETADDDNSAAYRMSDAAFAAQCAAAVIEPRRLKRRATAAELLTTLNQSPGMHRLFAAELALAMAEAVFDEDRYRRIGRMARACEEAQESWRREYAAQCAFPNN